MASVIVSRISLVGDVNQITVFIINDDLKQLNIIPFLDDTNSQNVTVVHDINYNYRHGPGDNKGSSQKDIVVSAGDLAPVNTKRRLMHL